MANDVRLATPDWVAEDALRIKRESQEAREGQRIRIRAPSPAQRVEARQDAYAAYRAHRDGGGFSPVREDLRYFADAYRELEAEKWHRGLADSQVRPNTSITGVDLQIWDEFRASTASRQSRRTARTADASTKPRRRRAKTAKSKLRPLAGAPAAARRRPGVLADEARAPPPLARSASAPLDAAFRREALDLFHRHSSEWEPNCTAPSRCTG